MYTTQLSSAKKGRNHERRAKQNIFLSVMEFIPRAQILGWPKLKGCEFPTKFVALYWTHLQWSWSFEHKKQWKYNTILRPVMAPYLIQEGQIMPAILLLAPPDFQTFLRPCIRTYFFIRQMNRILDDILQLNFKCKSFLFTAQTLFTGLLFLAFQIHLNNSFN